MALCVQYDANFAKLRCLIHISFLAFRLPGAPAGVPRLAMALLGSSEPSMTTGRSIDSDGRLPSALPVTLADVEAARGVISDAVLVTDCDHSRTLSEICGAEIWLKFENLQFTASFKERGALNRLNALSPKERKIGVIAMSAGNHAQGVAYHARRLGIPATIVMPVGTPMVKIENTRRHGAQVLVEGPTLEDAAEFAHTFGARQGLTFIHPYDDALVIAGQGTIACEMLESVPALDTLVVPIGGGGLISGIAVAAKAIKPCIRIVGVQARLYPSMYNAVKDEHLPMRGDTLAEGIAVDGMESLSPLLTDGMELLVDVVPKSSAVVLLDPERVRAPVDEIAEEDQAVTWLGRQGPDQLVDRSAGEHRRDVGMGSDPHRRFADRHLGGDLLGSRQQHRGHVAAADVFGQGVLDAQLQVGGQADGVHERFFPFLADFRECAILSHSRRTPVRAVMQGGPAL